MRSHANDLYDIRRAGRAHEGSKRGITVFSGNEIRQLIDEVRHQCDEEQCFQVRRRPLSAPPLSSLGAPPLGLVSDCSSENASHGACRWTGTVGLVRMIVSGKY
jgi:hypothetical protein